MPQLMNTAGLAGREREEAWRSITSDVFVPLDFTFPDPASFQGEITAEILGAVTVTRVSAGPHRAMRTERQVHRSADAAFYKVSMPLSGRVVVCQDGREAALAPGDLTIYDTARPYQISFCDGGRLLILMFPHRELRLPRGAVSALTARPVSIRSGIGGLVAPLLRNLADQLDEIGGGTGVRLADNVVDLLGTIYADLLDGAHRYPPPDPVRALMTRIRAFIEEHLERPDLDPETVAAACHLSVSYLHKLFRAEGTSVCRVIRERRLEHCRRDLAAPAGAHRAVGAVGAHWGFPDAAHFSRLFKAAYGVSPREYQLTHPRSCPSAVGAGSAPNR